MLAFLNQDYIQRLMSYLDDMNSLDYRVRVSRVLVRSCIHVLTSPRYHAVIISMKHVWSDIPGVQGFGWCCYCHVVMQRGNDNEML